MRQFLIFMLSYIVYVTTAHANTGVFLGAGSRVMPIKNDQIQLKSEEVHVTLTIPENSGKFGVDFIPNAHVKADFHLYNTSNKKISLQLGFPFMKPDIQSILNTMNFKVKSGDQVYKVQMKQGLIEKSIDPQGTFKKVFTWEDTFEPKMSKDIQVSYDLPMSLITLEAQRKLGTSGIEFIFHYITKTAYTWRQPVEKAIFQFDLTTLVPQVKTHAGLVAKPIVKALKIYQGKPLVGLVYPINGNIANNILTLTYTDKVPEEGIFLAIVAVFLPVTRKDMESYIKEIPLYYARANEHSFIPKPFNESEVLLNLLAFYKAVYQGKMTKATWSDGTFRGIPLSPKELKNFHVDYKVHLLRDEDRAEIAQIVDYLEEKLHIKKPNWFQRMYDAVAGVFRGDVKKAQ
jgi:hypothetical protein